MTCLLPSQEVGGRGPILQMWGLMGSQLPPFMGHFMGHPPPPSRPPQEAKERTCPS